MNSNHDIRLLNLELVTLLSSNIIRQCEKCFDDRIRNVTYGRYWPISDQHLWCIKRKGCTMWSQSWRYVCEVFFWVPRDVQMHFSQSSFNSILLQLYLFCSIYCGMCILFIQIDSLFARLDLVCLVSCSRRRWASDVTLLSCGESLPVCFSCSFFSWGRMLGSAKGGLKGGPLLGCSQTRFQLDIVVPKVIYPRVTVIV